MSDRPSEVTLRDIAAFHISLADMNRRGKAEGFANTFMRLLELFSSYLSDLPPGVKRRAEIWADHRTPNSFLWVIEQFADPADGQKPTLLLAGGLHFHEDGEVWGIHT